MTSESRPSIRQPSGVIAIVPARGGSKGLPGKNLLKVGDRSLVRRAVDACTSVESIDAVYVTTDDEAIAAEARECGAGVISRPPGISGDTASSESALLHALGELDRQQVTAAVVVFVQCTSPFVSPSDLAAAVDRVTSGSADTVFSAVESFEFVWRSTDDGQARGLNHDDRVRLRRQDRRPDWIETGAFYVIDAERFRLEQHRFVGRVEVHGVDPLDAVEIDTPTDLEIARAIDTARSGPESALLIDRVNLPEIDVVVTDFDGVHTDDRATVRDDGRESVTVSRRDGHGVKLLRSADIQVLILSTERNPVVMRRAEKLGVECIHGSDDKAAALLAWLDVHGHSPERVAYLGNDVNDAGCLALAGLAVCVADSHPDVIPLADLVLTSRGGEGAVRELADLLLGARVGTVRRSTPPVVEPMLQDD